MPAPVSLDIAEIVRLYHEEGLTGPQIARLMGVESTTIYSRLRAAKRPPPEGGALRAANTDRDAEIVRLYQEGANCRELADRFGVARTRVSQIVRRAGVRMRRRGGAYRIYSEEEATEVVRLYTKENLSQNAIALHMGFSQPVVSRILNAAGVETRGYDMRGSKHHAWRGGRIRSGAYVAVYVPQDDPLHGMANKTGYALEHRLVMARALGRTLEAWETVHHINGNREDNRLSNLQLRIGRHGKHVAYQCAECGSRNVKPTTLD